MTKDTEKPETDLPYDEAAHAMQTGVAFELERDPSSASPKHLRVGLNSTLVNDAAIARLLVKKGLITVEEYAEEVRLEMCREVDRYQARINERSGNGRVVLR
jgi:hypothetical protein